MEKMVEKYTFFLLDDGKSNYYSNDYEDYDENGLSLSDNSNSGTKQLCCQGQRRLCHDYDEQFGTQEP